MKLYNKDGECCEAGRDQIPDMEKAGWSKIKPEPVKEKTAEEIEAEKEADRLAEEEAVKKLEAEAKAKKAKEAKAAKERADKEKAAGTKIQ